MVDNTKIIKFIDLDKLTPHQLKNERINLKRKIKENSKDTIKYMDRICDINHRLRLLELGLEVNDWTKTFKRNK